MTAPLTMAPELEALARDAMTDGYGVMLLAELDAVRRLTEEHAKRAEGLRFERNEALTREAALRPDAQAWRDQEAELAADTANADDWIAENERIRALPPEAREAAVADAEARGVFRGDDLSEYEAIKKIAAAMPAFVRAVQQRIAAERDRDALRAVAQEVLDAQAAINTGPCGKVDGTISEERRVRDHAISRLRMALEAQRAPEAAR
jgi:hypothetical protein